MWTWVSLVASVPAFALFLAIEKRVAANGGSPLVNVHVIVRPTVSWALLTLMAATGTYYALLFTLAQYLQQGLGDSPLVSGLTLVAWVAAFGVAGQIVRRLPTRALRLAPAAGCLLLTASYLALSAALFSGDHGEALLVVVLGAGGLGLGIQFSALLGHLTNAVPAEYAPDISGVTTTGIQIGGAIGVAALGTLYLSLTLRPGAGLEPPARSPRARTRTRADRRFTVSQLPERPSLEYPRTRAKSRKRDHTIAIRPRCALHQPA
ncbi:MAG: MFS transporter [Actinomycetota bacterium]|nr:MFS transporter [Actinomycetota bacterium]